MSALLDTCVLIDLLRQDRRALTAVKAVKDRPFTCAVSLAELLAGARSQRDEARVDALVGSFGSVALTEPVFRLAGAYMHHYRASHGIDFPDALIAAAAEHHALPLMTLNVKHFPMFAKLKPAY